MTLSIYRTSIEADKNESVIFRQCQGIFVPLHLRQHCNSLRAHGPNDVVEAHLVHHCHSRNYHRHLKENKFSPKRTKVYLSVLELATA